MRVAAKRAALKKGVHFPGKQRLIKPKKKLHNLRHGQTTVPETILLKGEKRTGAATT